MSIIKRWVARTAPDEETVKSLAESIFTPETIAAILVQRGIKTYDEAKQYFRPQLSDLLDPFLMKDMDKAIARIHSAMANNEDIMIYGDYDVDGTTSVALTYSFFQILLLKNNILYSRQAS